MKGFIAFLAVLLSTWTALALPLGWQQIKPGGDTLCARGSDFSFLVHRGDPQKILVSFAAGGACWDEFTCDSDQIFTDTAEKTFRQVDRQAGVYDLNNKNNPYKDWTQVFIPYCTGDVHMGGGDSIYTRPDKTTFKIHHRGGINTKTALKWLQENYKSAREVNIDGCSAGSYASILWTPAVSEAYPQAKIFQFGDSGAGVTDELFVSQWQLDQNLPAWIPALDPARIDWKKLNIVEIYSAIAKYYPNIRFSQFNHHKDRIQILYYAAFGGNGLDWSSRMFNNMENTINMAANFKYFVAPGKEHCSMNSSSFYSTTTDGVSLRDWLAQGSGGKDVENVKCKECNIKVK